MWKKIKRAWMRMPWWAKVAYLITDVALVVVIIIF